MKTGIKWDYFAKKQKEYALKVNIQLNIFLLFSKNLAEFSEKNSKFTTLCDQASFQSLTQEEKDKIKKAMEDKF